MTAPFRFEDLNGKPEPAEWGPVYPDLGATVAKFRRINRGRDLTAAESSAYADAIGKGIRSLNKPPGAAKISLKYTMPDYAAKCRAEMSAAAERDNRAYRFGGEKGISGLTIEEAYQAAMVAKRAREAQDALAPIAAQSPAPIEIASPAPALAIEPPVSVVEIAPHIERRQVRACQHRAPALSNELVNALRMGERRRMGQG